MIPYGKQDINRQDIDAVIDVLKSDYLTQGPVTPHFEKSLARHVATNYGVAVNSATSALHIACLALEVGKGDVVWTSPVSFVASANCALYCGAKVDFVDIDKFSNNMSVQKLAEKLHQHKNSNMALPKVIIPVHLAGHSCDMEAIHLLSEQYGFKIIEDASHAIGASYKGQAVGCCKYSDITVFSFHPVKIITTGEGGMAVTSHINLYEKMRLLRSHGITRDENRLDKTSDGPWYYEQHTLGFNYRLTELQGALGLSQLSRLNEFIELRKCIANYYLTALCDLPIELPLVNNSSQSSWHLFIIKLQLEKMNKTHKQVFKELRDSGLGVNLHYIPIYRQPYYQSMGFDVNYCNNADDYYERAISIPIYHGMSQEDQKSVVNILTRVLS